MANPVTALREILGIAARIRAEQPKHPPVYSVESGVDPYGFFHEDQYVPFGWDLQPEPFPQWKEQQA